jgi:hypothetical protein
MKTSLGKVSSRIQNSRCELTWRTVSGTFPSQPSIRQGGESLNIENHVFKSNCSAMLAQITCMHMQARLCANRHAHMHPQNNEHMLCFSFISSLHPYAKTENVCLHVRLPVCVHVHMPSLNHNCVHGVLTTFPLSSLSDRMGPVSKTPWCVPRCPSFGC